MANLNLSTVELVSTLRAAPQNGSPSSQDYNDSWSEALADLASLAGFIDDILIPMLNGLDQTIQPNPQATPNGLEGRFIFGDTTDITPLFFDSLSAESLTIADSLRILNGIIQTTQTTIQTLNVEVTALQSQLSSTNQNDISQALQNFAASLQSLQAQVTANAQAILGLLVKFQTNGTDNAVQNKLNLKAGSNITITNLPSSGDVQFDVTSSGVQVKTGDYPLVVGDSGSVLALNSSSAHTFTLLDPPPSVSFKVGIVNLGTGVLTVSRNTLTINGRATNLTLSQGDSVVVGTDSTNYFTSAPRPFDAVTFAPGLGSNNQVLVRFKFTRVAIFPASAPNSLASASATATGSTAYALKKNGSSFATVVFSAGQSVGVFTQASDATFGIGDLFEIDGPATADASLADVSISLQGFRF